MDILWFALCLSLESRVCPTSGHAKEAAYLTPYKVYLQKGLLQYIRCPILRRGEELSLLFWFKGDQLVARYAHPAVGTNYTVSPHYRLTSLHGLTFHPVEENDQGSYACSVVPRATGVQRRQPVDVTVLGE